MLFGKYFYNIVCSMSSYLCIFLSLFWQNCAFSNRDCLIQVYLKFEQSMQDPSRVNILYERAVTDFPISADLWLDYTHYLNKTLKVWVQWSLKFFMIEWYFQSSSLLYFILQVGNVVRDVHLRATRNCPWVGELWVRYLLCLERCRSSEAEMSAVRIMYLCISGLAYLS